MSTATPADPPPFTSIPCLTGYDHFIQHLMYNDLVRDDAEVYTKSAEYWSMLTPWQKMQWDKLANDFMESYSRNIQYHANSMADKVPNLPLALTVKSSGTNQDATAQGATAHCTMPQGFAVQGAMAKGATAQGAAALGAASQFAAAQFAAAQFATPQSVMGQGGAVLFGAAKSAMAQGAMAQGATAQGAAALGAASQFATPQSVMAQGGAVLFGAAKSAMAQGDTAKGSAAQFATPQSVMAQGGAVLFGAAKSATAQGVAVQGAMAQGAMVQGTAAQGAAAKGATAQCPTAQTYRGQKATAQGYLGQRPTTRNIEILYETSVPEGIPFNGRAFVVAIPQTVDKMDAGISFKSYLYYGNVPKPEVRRFRLGHLDSYKFAPLQSMVRDIYQLQSSKFSIAWKDEDGDEVVISSDAEVKTMLSETQDGVLKLVVRCENDIKAQNPKPEAKRAPAVAAKTATTQGGSPLTDLVHKGVTCDGCGGPVIGYRYKCIACKHYDLCGKCEAAGKHAEHCFIRLTLPSLLAPSVLKTTIKDSRRVLKGIALASFEENKKLRRERKQTAEPNTQGKQDSQPRTSISWIEILAKYTEQFANIAGNLAHGLETETGTTEAATSTEPRSGETNISALTLDDIAQEHLAFGAQHLVALQRALKISREEDGTNLAVNSKEMDLKNVDSKLTQDEKDFAEAGPSPRQETNNLEAPKTYLDIGNPELAPTPAALSDSAKMAQITITGQGTPESASLKDIYVERGDISELANAVNQCEVSSNASSCSEGNGYEKAEGWTVVDAENLKDENADAAANVEDGPVKGEEPIRQQALLYPKLDPNSAVFNPRESVVASTSASAGPTLAAFAPAAPAPAASAPTAFAPTASAPTAFAPTASAPTVLAPAAPTKLTAEEAKKAQAAAATIAHDLRMQIAPHVEAALQQMEMMGFSNESGWLTQLLDHHNGNIAVVLDLIAPVKAAKASNAPNAGRK